MEHLLLDVEFPFRKQGIPRGKRKIISVNMRARTSVLVDIVDRNAFVPAVTLRRNEVGPEVDNYTMTGTLHGHDGTLWRPLGPSSGIDVETFRNECATFATWGTVQGERNPFGMRNPNVLVIDREFRPFILKRGEDAWPTDFDFWKDGKSELEHRRADAQRIANSLAVVDGHIWHRCHDPVWRLRNYRSAADVVVDDGFGFDGFRIDRRRDFEVFFEDSLRPGRTRRGYKKLKGPLCYVGEADIHDPSFFNRDDAEHLIPGLDGVLNGARSVILDLEPEAINTWVEFKEIVGNLSSTWSRTSFDHALHIMNLMRKALAAVLKNPDFDKREHHEVRWTIQQADEILRRCKLVEGWNPSGKTANHPQFNDIEDDALAHLVT